MAQPPADQRLRGFIEEAKEQFGYGSDADAFAHVAMREYFDLDDDDALEAADAGGSNDKGLDAFWHDREGRRVVIVQSKLSDGLAAIHGPEPVRQIINAYTWLTRQASSRSATAREQVLAAARRFADILENEPDYPVELYSIAYGKFSRAAEEEAILFNEAHEALGVQVRLVDADELHEAIEERLNRSSYEPVPEVTLRLVNHFELDGEPRALVATLDGAELAELEERFKSLLFQRNVRYFLKGTGKINKSIAATLKDDDARRNFWYYNNGLTIVCDAYRLDENQEHVAINNLQIVNGCQTTSTLGAFRQLLKDADPPALLLARIVESPGDELQSSITLYTNRQNVVRDRDLQSNDPLQDRLQREFARLVPAYYYERKRGEWEALTVQGKQAYGGRRARRIDNEKAAQAAYAFYREPDKARADKRLLFVRNSDGGFYEDIFNTDTSAESLLLPYLVAEYVSGEKKKYLQELREVSRKKNPSAGDRRVSALSWRKFADQFLLGAIAFYLEQEWRPLALRARPVIDNLDSVLPLLHGWALRDLRVLFDRKRREASKKDETFDPANFVKSNWDEVLDHLEEEWQARVDSGEEPLKALRSAGST